MKTIPQSSPHRYWHRLALAAILLLSTFLNYYRLHLEGYANLYYAAAVRSMGQSWHNFIFASFDPGGFVSVDKPPLGLWVQVLSTKIFGFSGWALLFPQALAGILSIALIYYLARRTFGVPAGLLAALVLALTPINVAANRNNTMDSQLVLTSLLAAWAVLLAVERGQLRFLLLSALLVGVGFNIKMLQAFMVLPAFYGLYLLTAPFSWLKRLAHLALASLVLAVACLAWPLAVDLTPADQRPFVGSSQNNTVMELILGHNGAARLGEIGKILGIGGNRSPGNRYPPQYAGPSLNPQPQSPLPPQNISPPAGASPSGMAPGGAGPLANETGEPGLLRLFNHQLAGQASWFLPLAIFLAALLPLAQRLPNLSSADSHFSRLVLYRYTLLWAGWLIPQTVFFSFAGLFHRYYLAMLAPAIAALVGGGLVALWRARQGWLNLLVWWITLGLELAIISAFPDWGRWLIPLMLALAGMTTLGMLTRHAPRAALVALFICLLPPTLWSLTPLIYGGDGALPYSGPELLERRAPPMGECQSPECRSDDRLIRYLQAQRGSTQFLVAMQSAMQAAPVILSTGEPVMALGGFSGSDAILSVEELSALVDAGAVRYFWLTRPAERNAIPPGGRLPPGAPGQAQSSLWVVQTCSPVLANEWGGAVNGNPMQLWDCR